MKISPEQLHKALHPHFTWRSHPERRLCVDVYPNGFEGMAIMIFVGLSDKFEVPANDVCEYLRINFTAYYSYLEKFKVHLLQAEAEPPDSLSKPGTALRKTKLVLNYISNNYRIEISI